MLFIKIFFFAAHFFTPLHTIGIYQYLTQNLSACKAYFLAAGALLVMLLKLKMKDVYACFACLHVYVHTYVYMYIHGSVGLSCTPYFLILFIFSQYFFRILHSSCSHGQPSIHILVNVSMFTYMCMYICVCVNK